MATKIPSSADVVIVGSGVCGALVAYEARKAGLSVLVLEAGPRGERGDFVQRFQAMSPYRRSHGDYQSPYPPSKNAPFPRYLNDDYLIVKGPDANAYKQGYLRYVGGTTWHWSGLAWRHLPVDLRLKSTYGVGRDWPFSYDVLEPYYARAEKELGVYGPSDPAMQSPAQRSTPYPMEPLPYGPADRRFAEVVNANGYVCVPIPEAKNSVVYDNRPSCCGNNSCMPICPIGAIYNAIVHVQKAEAAGAVVASDAVVYQIDTDAANKVTALHYFDKNKVSHKVTGKVFVLAGNGIETPRLLLFAANSKNPRGIANSSDQVGRNMMDHPGIHMGFVAKEGMWTGNGPVQLSSIVNFRDGAFRSEYSANKIMLNNSAQNTAAGLKALSMGLVGKALDLEIRRRAACTVDLSVSFEILPNADNRLVLSSDRKDPLGIPYPEVTYDVGEYVRKGAAKCKEELNRIANLFGGTEISVSDKFNANNHIMGGTIMGNDPSQSVVDGDGRTHDHSNLFIASGGNIPSTSVVNSTLSMAAIALKTADAVVAAAK